MSVLEASPEIASLAPSTADVDRVGRKLSPRQQALVYLVLALGAIAFLVPFYFVINGSLKTDAEVQAGNFTRPPAHLDEVKWSNYPRALDARHMNFRPALANTVVVTTLSVLGQILSSSLV